jgi:hypothetical protein
MDAMQQATEMTASKFERETELLGREAHDLAEAAEKLARNPSVGVACGDPERIAHAAQSLALRAARLAALKETAELYGAATAATEQ